VARAIRDIRAGNREHAEGEGGSVVLGAYVAAVTREASRAVALAACSGIPADGGGGLQSSRVGGAVLLNGASAVAVRVLLIARGAGTAVGSGKPLSTDTSTTRNEVSGDGSGVAGAIRDVGAGDGGASRPARVVLRTGTAVRSIEPSEAGALASGTSVTGDS